jgi:hypothetical protein
MPFLFLFLEIYLSTELFDNPVAIVIPSLDTPSSCITQSYVDSTGGIGFGCALI